MSTRLCIAIALTVGVFGTTGGAKADEREQHSGHHKNAQMEKLHRMMPMFAQAQSKIEEALSRRDTATALEETKEILGATKDLQKSKPHKNRKQIASFRKIAAAFEGDLKKTAALVNAGDFAGAKLAFDSAKTRCNDCHAKFRD